MKTPEEIKRGLEGCGGLDGDCENCPYDEQTIYCNDRLMRDALAYIQQLEFRIAQAERERDELLKNFKACVSKPQKACKLCENRGKPLCSECERWDLFKWRGVCPEAPKEQKA